MFQLQDERAPAQEAGSLQAETALLQNAQLQELLDGCRRELADVYSQVEPMLIPTFCVACIDASNGMWAAQGRCNFGVHSSQLSALRKMFGQACVRERLQEVESAHDGSAWLPIYRDVPCCVYLEQYCLFRPGRGSAHAH